MSIKLTMESMPGSGVNACYIVEYERKDIGRIHIFNHRQVDNVIVIAVNQEDFYTGYLTVSTLDDTPERAYESGEEPSSDLEYILFQLAETLVRDLG